jgi:DinB superfamily
MIEYVQDIFRCQLEAALCMLNQCIEACPAKHWEDKIANGTFRWVAYHTLFFTDLYLSPSNESFELRELHRRGGDEREDAMSVGLSKEESLAYAAICRRKVVDSLAAETRDTLAGESGFSWYPISRGELHLCNLRHIQHHTGQLSAYLRRIDHQLGDRKSLPWIRTGWR